jgi:hypothetical protein
VVSSIAGCCERPDWRCPAKDGRVRGLLCAWQCALRRCVFACACRAHECLQFDRGVSASAPILSIVACAVDGTSTTPPPLPDPPFVQMRGVSLLAAAVVVAGRVTRGSISAAGGGGGQSTWQAGVPAGGPVSGGSRSGPNPDPQPLSTAYTHTPHIFPFIAGTAESAPPNTTSPRSECGIGEARGIARISPVAC